VTATLRPVPDAPALLLTPGEGRRPVTLVVADLHLGLGGTPDAPGGPPEGSAERLEGLLAGLARDQDASRVLVAGDVKHPIVGTPPPLRPVVFNFFAGLLARGLGVDLVPGNHDVGLVRHLPREVRVYPPSGVVRDGVGIFHGHRWPSDRVLRAPKLVTGHLHPGFRFAPTPENPDGKRRGWVRVEFAPGALAFPRQGRGKRRVPSGTLELIVLPAFNPLAGTEALNRGRPRRGRSFLFQRFLSRGAARGYLLDGTDVGRLVTGLSAPDAPRGASRDRPGR
jgi:uncharacterized protein